MKSVMDNELLPISNNKEPERSQWAKAILKLCEEYKIDLAQYYATTTN
jgi:hypothetical protein